MASAIMHLCIAKKINEKLKRDKNMLYLGAIAPDISKQLGEDRSKSHFGQTPNLWKFRRKYPDFYKNDFELGYYIHLESDVIWTKKYMRKLVKKNNVNFLSGKRVKVSKDDIAFLLYNDYTTLNVDLIDRYGLDLKLFFNPMKTPITKIREIEVRKLQVIIDKMGLILTESKGDKNYIIDIDKVSEYIDYASEKILRKIERKYSK